MHILAYPLSSAKLFCFLSVVKISKADIRNPLRYLQDHKESSRKRAPLMIFHERSRFATCQWELSTPTDISIPLTHRLVLRALEAGNAYLRSKAILFTKSDKPKSSAASAVSCFTCSKRRTITLRTHNGNQRSIPVSEYMRWFPVSVKHTLAQEKKNHKCFLFVFMPADLLRNHSRS